MKQSLPKELNKLDTIEAIDGMILVTTKEGKTSRLTIREAIQRAISINSMPMNTKEENRVKLLLVDQIQTKIREAKSQIESPDNKRQALITNVLQGRNEKGEVVQETMEQKLRYYMIKYPTLDEKQVLTVLETSGMDLKMADEILGAVHRSNGQIYMPGGEMHNKIMDPNFKHMPIGTARSV